MAENALGSWLSAALAIEHKGEYYNSLSQLTVVIPSYNRQDFLVRQCAYWSKSGATLIIADGSTKPLSEQLRGIVATATDVLYIHSAASFVERLAEASKHIKTRYAVLLGDDEFYLHSGLASAIAKLDSDAALAACMTQSLSFFCGGGGRPCTYGPGYPHVNYFVTHEEPHERLVAAMSDYRCASNYAVLRADVWRRSWGQLGNWSSPYAAEIQQGIITLIWGKLTTVSDISWLRSNENRAVNHVTFNRGLSFFEWWTLEEFKSERARFISTLSAELVAAHKFEPKTAEQLVLSAVSHFVEYEGRVRESQMATTPSLRKTVFHLLKRTLMRLMPGQLLWQMKSILFIARIKNVEIVGPLGDLNNLSSVVDAGLDFDNESAQALSKIELLIADFYRVRSVS